MDYMIIPQQAGREWRALAILGADASMWFGRVELQLRSTEKREERTGYGFKVRAQPTAWMYSRITGEVVSEKRVMRPVHGDPYLPQPRLY
jgi:hypothetical protein